MDIINGSVLIISGVLCITYACQSKGIIPAVFGVFLIAAGVMAFM